MQTQALPWKELYEIAVQCCQYTDVRSFSIGVLREIHRLVDFDEAIVFYLDINRKVTDYYLYNVNPKWLNLYLSYYSQADHGTYGISQRNMDGLDDVYVHQWSFEHSSEVIPDYIRPRNLVGTLAFPMRDQSGCVRTILAMDRVSAKPYTQYDVELVRALRRLLNLHHQLLFGVRPEWEIGSTELQSLTVRETEVLNLLRQGLSPASIAHILHITVSTTNRHIYNIYQKLKVNSRPELMAKLNQNR